MTFEHRSLEILNFNKKKFFTLKVLKISNTFRLNRLPIKAEIRFAKWYESFPMYGIIM